MFFRPYLAILAMLGALLGATVAAHAQTYPLPTPPSGAAGANQGGPVGGVQHPRPRMRMVLRELDLTPDQRSQIRSMMRAFRASRATAAPMTRQDLLGHIEGVLTPEQRTRFEAGMHPHRRLQPAIAPNA